LAEITTAFRDANIKIKVEAHRNQKWLAKSRERGSTLERGHFGDAEVEILRLALLTSNYSSEYLLDRPTDLMEMVTDQSTLGVWGIAVEYMIDYQSMTGPDSRSYWRMAKTRAFDILELRDLAAERFDNVEDELRSSGLDKECRAIRRKLAALTKFKSIYDAQPDPIGQIEMPSEPTYRIYYLKDWNKKTAEAYPSVSNEVSVPNAC
jgi:hypothetical protein